MDNKKGGLFKIAKKLRNGTKVWARAGYFKCKLLKITTTGAPCLFAGRLKRRYDATFQSMVEIFRQEIANDVTCGRVETALLYFVNKFFRSVGCFGKGKEREVKTDRQRDTGSGEQRIRLERDTETLYQSQLRINQVNEWMDEWMDAN